jgi:membrane peptidoglycan carboxypeptidase
MDFYYIGLSRFKQPLMLKKLIRSLAKRLYRKKYCLLKERLLVEFLLVQNNQSINFDPLSKILISGEDHRFYYHIGFDIIAIFRAIRNRIFYNKIEGASTIEQQLVRVLINDFDKTFNRKIQEILLATTLTSIIPKNTIPKIYLNVAYYGTGMNGLNQAIHKLGIQELAKMQIEQAAEIVSRIKYPQPINPNKKRLIQIETRKRHLVSLYNRHIKRKYFKIYG